MRISSKLQHQILLLALVLLLIYHTVSGSKMHHIMPIVQCSMGESCLTLSMLAANTSNYLDSNTTLIFLEGNHTLDSELFISNTELLRLSTKHSATTSVTCSGNASLNFSNIRQLQISGLKFIGCSSSVDFVDYFTLEDSSFHGRNGDGSALKLAQTNTNVVRSSFTSNTVGTYQSYVRILENLRFYDPYRQLSIQSYSARVGGALLVASSNLVISSSHFDSNTAELGGAIFSELGSNITTTNCIFCLLYTSPSPRDATLSRMPSSA